MLSDYENMDIMLGSNNLVIQDEGLDRFANEPMSQVITIAGANREHFRQITKSEPSSSNSNQKIHHSVILKIPGDRKHGRNHEFPDS